MLFPLSLTIRFGFFLIDSNPVYSCGDYGYEADYGAHSLVNPANLRNNPLLSAYFEISDNNLFPDFLIYI
jgi:hypothetical protein